jgi:aminoglycoside/choline kinase family phosphotransferase
MRPAIGEGSGFALIMRAEAVFPQSDRRAAIPREVSNLTKPISTAAADRSRLEDTRLAALRRWLGSLGGLEAFELTPASSDASFRRYFRVRHAQGTAIAMDAPPEQENSQPFLHVAGLMRAAGLHVPQVLASDLAQGFLLLSDLGTQTYLQAINDANADALFTDAIGALIRWQRATHAGELPAYDDALLRRELALFPEWYLGRHHQMALTRAQRNALEETNDMLVRRALSQSQVYVHRDFMPRNLMISTPNPGVLDFQDAVCGAISYDVVSLFKDAFLSWPEGRVQEWARQYWEAARATGLPVPAGFDGFLADFEWMGVQRHLKVLGIFARINYRDGKPGYLADTPRFFGYVRAAAARHAALAPLAALCDDIESHAARQGTPI